MAGQYVVPKEILAEFEKNARNGQVGSLLVSETDEVRVWHILLQPGERLPVHCHVLDYFWTATSDGRGSSHYSDGRVAEREYLAGDTMHFRFGPGESMMHDLKNTGERALTFVTVEFKTGKNDPLPVPA